MNNNKKVSFWYSWPAIILAFCFFWPVGLILLIKRFSIDKKAAISAGGKGMKGLGIGLIVFGAIGFMGCVSDPEAASGTWVALFFIIGGIALVSKAKKLKKEAESIKQYLAIVVNGNVRQLDTIASTTGKSYDVVHKDIQNMIDKGYLKNAYIDEGMRAVVLPNSVPAPQNNVSTVATNAVPVNVAPTQSKIVVCSCCGANNTIYGDMGECEYCGSPLK